MFPRIERLVVVLILTALLVSHLMVNLSLVSGAAAGGNIDVFTQREPFSGKGFNVSSDAFCPGETVILYANVTYNGYGVWDDLVAFAVEGPPNPNSTISLYYSAFTNASGIATISFGISQMANEVIGYWHVSANVREADVVIHDILTFRVGWIVEITSIETMDLNRTVQDKFTRNSGLITMLTVKSISMEDQRATLTVTINDSRSKPVDYVVIDNFVVPANETPAYAYPELFIPGNASLGVATAFASAFTKDVTVGGIPYCPEVSTSFYIIDRDVAIVGVSTSDFSVHQGQNVSVDVTAKNYGEVSESFLVSLFANDTLVDSTMVSDLQSSSSYVLHFTWDTHVFALGTYNVNAYAAPVPGEIDVANNWFFDGFVNVASGLIVHDVAVLNVVPASTSAYIGEILNVNVTAKNKGTETESFDVILYYSLNIIDTFRVVNLTAGSETVLTFHWDTERVSEGDYTLTAFAVPVAGETSTIDNHFDDGTVSLAKSPSTFFLFSWFFWLLLLLLLILLLILIPLLWLYYKRRKKNDESFYKGWTAWYYGQILPAQRRVPKKRK